MTEPRTGRGAETVLRAFRNPLADPFVWILGRIVTSGWSEPALMPPYFLVSAAVVPRYRRSLDVLAVGDEEAAALGRGAGHRCDRPEWRPTMNTTDTPPTDTPPTEDPRPRGMRAAKSLVVVNTGDGKGKSSAAFGTVLRARARGWPVAVVQFLKSEDWVTGEQLMADPLGIDFWSLGEGFTWDSHNLSRDEAVAREAWHHGKALVEAGEHRLVVFDEITYPLNWGWIDAADVEATFRNRPERVSLVLTGRDAPTWMVAMADIATEMVKTKHAFDDGILAKKGIDF